MKNKIVYAGKTFTPTDIKSGQLHLVASLPSMKLEPNTIIVVVKSEDDLTNFTRNTPLYYYHRDKQICISYVQTVDRIGPNKYKFYGTSAIGRLIEQPHAGGIYTGQTAEEVITDICGPVPFEIKNILKKIKLYGWLPYANPPKRSARDNLVQVLFAIGASVRTDLDGVLRIACLWDGVSGNVGREKIYTGASAEYDGIVTQVIVTEHQYVPWTEEKQLFEGTAQAEDIITFDDPMHDLAAEGFTILASGANWAKVSAGSGTLTGKTYIHNTRQVSKAVQTASTPNVKTVENATLVSLVNAQAVADRLALYYRCREQVDASVVYQGESPGDRLATYHPFDKVGVDACLESADITLSNTLKAQEKLLVGFVPPQSGEMEYYDTWEIFTSDGEFLVPFGTTSVRAILVGGGDGGASGEYGEHAKKPVPDYFPDSILSKYFTGVFGKGGKGGLPGKGGKVLSVDADVTPGSVISYKIGKGGKGGIKNSSGSISGTLGGDTIFGGYSSKDGVSSPEGMIIPIIDLACSGDGKIGISGGDGSGAKESEAEVHKPTISIGNSVTDYNGNVWNAGYPNTDLESIQTYFGWMNAPQETRVNSVKSHGGGAAVGSNGGNGDYGIIVKTGNLTGYAYTGVTGKGADAIAPIKAQGYGKGGDGGHGGGGEGGSGRLAIFGGIPDTINLYIGTMSGPGKGSDGADGADGCLILFYRAPKGMNAGQLVDKNNKMVLDRLGRRIIM